MDYRSYLFVPGDQPRKMVRAAQSMADAIILDLEDAVGPALKAEARGAVAQFLDSDAAAAGPAIFIRVNDLRTGLTGDDIAATAQYAPRGYVLPKCEGPEDIDALAEMIAATGQREVAILAIATETVRAVRNLGRCDWSHPMLAGLTWGGEDLMADMGALRNRDTKGDYLSPFTAARDLCLMAALEAGVAPVDAVFTNFRDLGGLYLETSRAAEIGFLGKLAIHPDQIAPIHEAFLPSTFEIEWAQNARAALEASHSAVTCMEGEMLDLPHLRRAERILARAAPRVQSH